MNASDLTSVAQCLSSHLGRSSKFQISTSSSSSSSSLAIVRTSWIFPVSPGRFCNCHCASIVPCPGPQSKGAVPVSGGTGRIFNSPVQFSKIPFGQNRLTGVTVMVVMPQCSDSEEKSWLPSHVSRNPSTVTYNHWISFSGDDDCQWDSEYCTCATVLILLLVPTRTCNSKI